MRLHSRRSRAQRLQRWRTLRTRHLRNKTAVQSVTSTPTDVATATATAAPTLAAAAAVPSDSATIAAAAPAAPNWMLTTPDRRLARAMVCLRHREEYPLGPHCPRILQFSTNVHEAAAAQFERLRAEHAAVPMAALHAAVDRAVDALRVHDSIPYAPCTEREVLRSAWESTVRAIDRRNDELDLMPRATQPCPDGCTPPDDWRRRHIPYGACQRCTTRDTESISSHFIERMQKHSCFHEDASHCVHGIYAFEPPFPFFWAL